MACGGWMGWLQERRGCIEEVEEGGRGKGPFGGQGKRRFGCRCRAGDDLEGVEARCWLISKYERGAADELTAEGKALLLP